MKTLKDLKYLTSYLLEVQHIESAISLLSWDQETYMPPGAGAGRAEQLSALEGMAHEKSVGAEMERLLSQSVDLKSGDLRDNDWDEASRALLREVWRDYDKGVKLPNDFVRRLGRETSIAHQVWVEARKRNDFASFAPSLKKIVALKKEEADYLGYKASPYDALLDAYEPGLTVAQVAPLFASLKGPLVSLLKKIMSAPAPSDDFLHAHFAPKHQLAFGRRVLEAMGFDFRTGRQDISAHPFTTSFHPTDVRITTRVDEGDLLSSLFSSIHEGGHALYDQGLNPDYFGTPLGEALSLGIHESQSRLWENGVGRSKAFWRHFYPILRGEIFPEALKGVDLERFYAAINIVRPSLIRVEADELTYNLHIMIRFEIERALIEENLPVEKLPALWNEKMREYLGVVPDSDADGVLQDVHWSGGAIGYFPTYTLGNLYSVQFLNQAKKEIPDLSSHVEKGDLLPLKTWLNEKIHRWGRMYPSDELVRRVTGEALDPRYFIEYLHHKFGEIYRI